MCKCNNQNCGCTPEDYTSSITYDGLKFKCPDLAVIKPNCNNLNDLLELWGEKICSLLETTAAIPNIPFDTLVLPIDSWAMDSDATKDVPHNLSLTEYQSIVGIYAIINNDTNSLKTAMGGASGTASNGSVGVDATNVKLERTAGEIFDNLGYNADVAIGRGSIIINYTKD
jgi:hypothetical protein